MSIDLTGPDFEFLRQKLRVGEVTLFCGAGFSVDATNAGGTSPPLGNALAEKLAELAGLPYHGESLPMVYQVVSRQVGTSALHDQLRSLYKINGCADWYSLVADFVWHRIYTTNVDDLIEFIFRRANGQQLHSIVCPAPPAENDRLMRTLHCIHLHGSVTAPEKGLTFTLEDFADQAVSPNPWYQQLIDDFYFHPVVFVGTMLQEPPFQHYLELRGHKGRDYGTKETRPKSYLVTKTISKIFAESLRTQNIIPVEATARDFFEALRATISADETTLLRVQQVAMPYAFSQVSDSRRADVVAYFNPIVPDNLPRTPRAVPHSFYLGAEPTWRDIEEQRDGKRRAQELILEELQRHGNRFTCIVLHGPAGAGKTTLLKRIAYDLARDGQHVYFARDEEEVSLEGLLQVCKDIQDPDTRVYVCVDNLHRHLWELHRRSNDLLDTPRLSLIVADNTNRYATRAHALEPLNPSEVRIGDLTEDEVESIIARLEHFNFLGHLLRLSHEERIHAFMKRASRQLLVAMKEATSGRGFDAILEEEFRDLPRDAKLAYTICCLAVAQGAQGVYRKVLLPSLGKTDFKKSQVVAELLNGVLVSGNESGTLLRPRHQLIAHEVAYRIASVATKIEAITSLLQQLSSEVTPKNIRSRTPAFLAYRGLINSEALYEILNGDRQAVIGLYEELEPYYNDQFLFWLHYAMAYIGQGDLDIGETYLEHARAICDNVGANPFQILHQQGILYLTKAARMHPPALGVELADKGIDLLHEQIRRRGDTDTHAYGGYLEYTLRWYVHAGDLIPPSQWEALRVMAQEATSKHRLDDVLLEARNKVERAYLLRAAISDPDIGQVSQE